MKTSIFKVSDFFDIRPTKSYKMTNHELMSKDGHVPVLTNTSTNNGIGGWSDLEPTEKGPMITFSDTTTGPDTVFVQTKPFIGYSHVQGLYSNTDHKWTELELLYFVVTMRAGAGTGWSYATKFNRKLVSNFDIELPVTSAGDPDFEYMTMRIRELEAERIRELEAYLRVTGLDDTTLSASEAQALTQKVQWKKFRIGDLFDYRRGKESAPKKVSKGDIPLISETSSNNGFVRGASSTHVFPAKTITVSVNYAQTVFLQLKEFCASVNIIILVPKFDNVSDAALLYFVALLRANNSVYDYNYKISKDRLMNTVLLVPVTSTGVIDFDYMQNYIRTTEKRTIRGVVEYKDRVIAETKKVVNE